MFVLFLHSNDMFSLTIKVMQPQKPKTKWK